MATVIKVPVQQTRYGYIALTLSDEEAKNIIGEDLSPLTRKKRVKKLAQKRIDKGDPINWYDEFENIYAGTGYMEEEEE